MTGRKTVVRVTALIAMMISLAAGFGPIPVRAASEPGQPTIGVASALSGAAWVTWTAPGSDGGSPIDWYIITAYGNVSPIAEQVDPRVACSGTTCGAKVKLTTYATNGLYYPSYEFTVKAESALGDGPESDRSNYVVPLFPGPPSAPRTPATTPGNRTATLTWLPPLDDGGYDIASYNVMVVGDNYSQMFTSGGGCTQSCSYHVAGLTNGATYHFSVQAINTRGVTGSWSVQSDPFTPTPVAPGTPSSPIVKAADQMVSVRWSPPQDDGGSAITGYTITVYVGSTNTVAASQVTDLTPCSTSGCTISISGLTNGTAYTATVQATNILGTSPESARSNSVTPAPGTVPAAPLLLSATRGDGSAAVTWSVPNDGGSPISGYTISAYSGGSTTAATTQAVPAGCTTPCRGSITGLRNGTTYALTVAATNALGTGAESNRSTSVTPAGVPGRPTNLSVSPGDKTASVSWWAPGDNGSAITAYTISVYGGLSLTTPLWTLTTGASVCSGVQCSATMPGFTNGTEYFVTVKATNSVGTGPESWPSDPFIPAAVPGAPSIGAATMGPTGPVVTWSPPASNGGSPITHYVITAYTGSTVVLGQSADTSACSAGQCKTVVSGLSPATTYTFTVDARNAIGASNESNHSNAVTMPSLPGAPTIGTATPRGESVTVTWSPPADDGGGPIASYLVDVIYTDSPTQEVYWEGNVGNPCTNTGCSYTVIELQHGIRFNFRVKAINAAGAGPASLDSNTVTAGLPGPPIIGSATGASSSAIVTWQPSNDFYANSSDAVTGYTVVAYQGTSNTVVTTQFATCSASTCTSGIAGLTNGQVYTFAVKATNSLGTGPESARSNPIIAGSSSVPLPGAPTIGTATAGSGTATVTWTPPTDDGGYAVQSYTITPYYSPSGGQAGTSPVVLAGTPLVVQAGSACTASNCSATVTGLTNGTSYMFTVKATNMFGSGSESADSNSVTPLSAPTAPGAPGIGTATAGNASASVSWKPPASNGGSAITIYVISAYASYLSAFPVKTQTVSASGCSTTCSATVTGLTNGTTYTFTVKAVNSVGTGRESARSNAVTPATAPGAPTIGTATAGNASASVTWTPPRSSGGSSITSYTISAYTGSLSLVPVKAQQVSAPTCGTTCSATVTGLTNGTTYTFTVKATNSVGNSQESARSNAVTPSAGATAPAAPVIGTATAGNASATVKWSPPASNGGSAITGYTITAYTGTTASKTQPASTSVCATTCTATFTGLTNGTAYTFTVKATNAAGTSAESSHSNTVTPTATGLPSAPCCVSASAGNGSAIVDWGGDGGGFSYSNSSYTITVYLGSTNTVVKTVTVQASFCSACMATVTGLTNGTAYTFTVKATNSAGTGPESARSNAVTPSAPHAAAADARPTRPAAFLRPAGRRAHLE